MPPSEVPDALRRVFSAIDKEQERFVATLREAVAIKSVSLWPEARDDIIDIMSWMKNKLEAEDVVCELKAVGSQSLPDGSAIPLPPVLIGCLGSDPTKKTVLVYGHLDVQPAFKEDGWNTDPFELVEKDEKLYGRGSSDDKGPVLGWLNVVQAHREADVPLPVNLKFVIEGMEESGSEGLEDLLLSMKNTDFLKDVDYACVSDNNWLGPEKPCLIYGLRGLCYFDVQVHNTDRDLHSDVLSGAVPEALADLLYILNNLTGPCGQILVPGIMDNVAPVTDKERALYNDLDFDMEVFRQELGCSKLAHGDKGDLLMAMWRFPSLSIHGVEGAFDGSGAKAVIPGWVSGKFSIRTVPNQEPKKVEKAVMDYLDTLWKHRKSFNVMKASMISCGRYWVGDPFSKHFQAAAAATKLVYGVYPDMIREGGSVPVTAIIQEVTGKEVICIPMGASDDAPHSESEKLDRRNYIEGTKLFAAYLYEISLLE
uniref:Putative metalloexopeptidase n=1 Tax=Ornithodoros turicata TaxID=34597 RepID=A0A2R5LEL2_9ACAR